MRLKKFKHEMLCRLLGVRRWFPRWPGKAILNKISKEAKSTASARGQVPGGGVEPKLEWSGA